LLKLHAQVDCLRRTVCGGDPLRVWLDLYEHFSANVNPNLNRGKSGNGNERDGSEFDVDGSESGRSVGSEGQYAAIHCDGKLQRRQHSEFDRQSDLEFIEFCSRGGNQNRFSDWFRDGQQHHSGGVGFGCRVDDPDCYGCGAVFDCGHSAKSFHFRWDDPAVYGYGNLQRWLDAEPDELGDLELLKPG
jgi:hypothetical protein